MANFNNPTALLAQLLAGGNGSGSGKGNGNSRTSQETVTAEDGTYRIGNSSNRLARLYAKPHEVEAGCVMSWQFEGVDTPRVVALFREVIDILTEDYADDSSLPIDQRPVELASGLVARITQRGQWHGGQNYSLIMRLSPKGELPMPKVTGGVKKEGKGRVKRGDYVIIDDANLVKVFNAMFSDSEQRGQTTMTGGGSVETE